MDKQGPKLDGNIDELLDNIKSLGKNSKEILNKLVTPEIEAQLPDDVKAILYKGRNAFNLNGLSIREKQQDLMTTQNEISSIIKDYGNSTN